MSALDGVDFTDPTNPGRELQLFIDGRGPTVRHPPCTFAADVSVELDAWFCPSCEQRGRISGAFVVEQAELLPRSGGA